ncbi:hypothetical protein BJY04DRAFT_219280 [Aspergillus karnatakaensis]|uniref:uncharacterized protein n=1 Tax=Aspergillus karnatakaensis TaxID=1810916 RepID=UPI003CCE2318
MPASISKDKGTVAIVGSGPAGLFAAWALLESGYEVTVFEKHDHLTLARHATGQPNDKPSVDIPMRTFSGGYYANLFQVLNYLNIQTTIHRFHYTFSNGPDRYFQFFSNFHRVIPCLQNDLLMNIYVFLCYIWYTIAVFLFPPHAKGLSSDVHTTESLDQYAQRIHLPDIFLDWYLLPLFASVSTCSHADLRECPAAYIADYRKRTFGAHHRTVTDMQGLQDRLTAGIHEMLQTEVHSVTPHKGKVIVTYSELGNTNINMQAQTLTFDHIILATSAKQTGKLHPAIGEIASSLNEGRVRITVSKSDSSTKSKQEAFVQGSSEPLVLTTRKDPTLGHVTHSMHHHPAGLDVTVSPCLPDEFDTEETHDEVLYLTRPLPTPRSHDLLLDVFSKVTSNSTRAWKNGTDGIYLAGGYASAGLPLLEACVRSGLEAAVAIGAELPFEIVMRTPF